MPQEVDAVYENGVLRPLSPLALTPAETVHIFISGSQQDRSEPDVAMIDRARAELAGRADIPTIGEVRRALAGIAGNWSDDVIALRGEY